MAFNKSTIKEKKQIAPGIIELVISPKEQIKHTEGQFVSFKIPRENGKFETRSYSIANHPEDKGSGILRFAIKELDGGLATQYFKTLKNGDELEFIGPSGRFSYQSSNAESVYFICTGTGMVPLLAMLESELKKDVKTKLTLLFGSRSNSDIFWQKRLDDLEKKYSNFKYDICLSRPDKNWSGKTGYVTTLCKEAPLDWEKGHFYLCGNPNMINDMQNILTKKGVSEKRIFFERFTSPGKAKGTQ